MRSYRGYSGTIPAQIRISSGASFVVSVGKWGGFGAWVSKVSGIHITIGWLAIALWTFDIDVALGEAVNVAAKGREEA